MAYGNGYKRGGGNYNRGNGGRSYGGYNRGYNRNGGGGYNNRDSNGGDYDNSNRAGVWGYEPGLTINANGKPSLKGRGQCDGKEIQISAWMNLPKDRDLAKDIVDILIEWHAALAREADGNKSKPIFGIIFDQPEGGDDGGSRRSRRSSRRDEEPEDAPQEEAPKARRSSTKKQSDTPIQDGDEEIPF